MIDYGGEDEMIDYLMILLIFCAMLAEVLIGEDEMIDYLMILLIFCAMLAEVLIVIFVSADVIIEILEGD